jgi:hypothetical protein
MYVGLQVKYPPFLSDQKKKEINFHHRFFKNTYMKFHENLSGGSQDIPSGRTQTDMI